MAKHISSSDAEPTSGTAAIDSSDAPAAAAPSSSGSTSAGASTTPATNSDAAATSSPEDKPIATTTSPAAPTPASGDTETRSATPAKKPTDRKKPISSANQQVKAGSDAIRGRIASLVWLLAVLAALILAVGALLWSLDANRNNQMVTWVLHAAGTIDGPFWRIFQLNDPTKNHLVNWGLAAVVYLIVGRIADRVIRP